MEKRKELYRGDDVRRIPLYTVAEAARYLHLPRTTLRYWVNGRTYTASGEARRSPRLIERPDPGDYRLSFNNLVEAHILRALSLSRSGRFAMEKIWETFLRRLTLDAAGRPLRLYPFITSQSFEDGRVVSIDPRVAYGRPSIACKGISTAILAERVNAGESIRDLAYYYDLDEKEIEEAIVYESHFLGLPTWDSRSDGRKRLRRRTVLL